MIIPGLSLANLEMDNTLDMKHSLELTSCNGNQSVELSLDDVVVWTFNGWLIDEEMVDMAAYVNPQYCKRAWFKYSEIQYDAFPDPAYSLWTIPPLLNEKGALFEGGVQCAHIQQNTGWPCDNEYDEDHELPYEVPDPVFDDFATRNADGNICWLSNYEYNKCNAAIANENWRDFILYWAYEQIDANVNALEFDQINAGYRFTISGTPEENSNDGYDDYSIGTANFANRLSVVCGHGMVDPIDWFMPNATGSSGVDSAKYAFDDNPETYWKSTVSDSHWIEIDFGRTRTVQQIYLWLHPEHILNDFCIKYWNDSLGWVDFTPTINVTGNIELTRSFLVEPISTGKIKLISQDNEIYLPELQFFGHGFRQFLLKKYCVDSSWTVTDPRWETKKLVDLADLDQCPDGTMNTFNYRKYLEYHGWTGNPFGTSINTTNLLNPANPFFWDWFPTKYLGILMQMFFSDSDTFSALEKSYSESYSYQRTYLNFWFPIMNSVRAYASSLGRNVYVARNGFLTPSSEDYLLCPLGAHPIFPVYDAPSVGDPHNVHLDGSQARITIWRMLKEYAIDSMDQEVPFVAFCDFCDHMPFAHLGGIDKPADEREIYLRTYPMEMRAAGVNFCYPVIESEENSWLDSTSDGTLLIDIIKQQTDFLNAHKEIYRNVTINDGEAEVKVNGVTPFNGEWNMVGNGIDSSVNESKVTISYMDLVDGTKSYLHIINHNWNDVACKMIPQSNVPVEIPVKNHCSDVMVVSPDFPGEHSLDFWYENGTVQTMIPTLAYYDVIEISYGVNVNIKKPKEGCLYIADRKIISTIFDNALVIGKITIEVDAFDEEGTEKVEFYVDSELKYVDDELPYEWLLDETIFGRHCLEVVAYDKEGNEAKDNINIIIFNIGE